MNAPAPSEKFRRLELVRFDKRSAPIDTRKALGTVPSPEGMNGSACACCWPAQVTAEVWNAEGNPVCLFCATHAPQRRRLPIARPSSKPLPAPPPPPAIPPAQEAAIREVMAGIERARGWIDTEVARLRRIVPKGGK